MEPEIQLLPWLNVTKGKEPINGARDTTTTMA